MYFVLRPELKKVELLTKEDDQIEPNVFSIAYILHYILDYILFP